VKKKKSGANAEAYREYVSRWQRINALQLEEERRKTPADRLREFFQLMDMAKAMNWETTSPAEVEEVRARWRKLREAHRAKTAR
jgi:hypothetical protein